MTIDLTAWTHWIGTAAAVLTTSSFIPQVWLTWRSRDVAGISLGMYSVFTLGVALWLAYGVLLRQWPLILANSLTLSLALMVLAMKLAWGRPRPPVAAPAVWPRPRA
jgi:MtN3 and saliva related transmembrane protein